MNKGTINKCKYHFLEMYGFCMECLSLKCPMCVDIHLYNSKFLTIQKYQQLHSKLHFYIYKHIKHFTTNIHKSKNIVFYINKAHLVVYNPVIKQKFSINIDKSVDNLSTSIFCHTSIYIIGGYKCKNVYEVNLFNHILAQKQSMNSEKWHISLCSVYRSIYSIGGYDGFRDLDDVQRYDICINQWSSLPSLPKARFNIVTFSFNNLYIYSMFGRNNISSFKDVERIKISNPQSWEVISVQCCPKLLVYRQAIQWNKKQILMFGGKSNIKDSANECFLINIERLSIAFTSTNSLVFASNFSGIAPIKVKGYVYAIDEDHNVHIANTHMQWDAIKKVGIE